MRFYRRLTVVLGAFAALLLFGGAANAVNGAAVRYFGPATPAGGFYPECASMLTSGGNILTQNYGLYSNPQSPGQCNADLNRPVSWLQEQNQQFNGGGALLANCTTPWHWNATVTSSDAITSPGLCVGARTLKGHAVYWFAGGWKEGFQNANVFG